jgi:Tfp pilus assembly protein PilO
MGEKTKLLITIGVGVVVNLGVWGFFYKLNNDLTELNKKLEKLRADNTNLQKEANRLKEVEDKIKEYQDKNKDLLSQLPLDSKRTEFLQKVSELATAQQLENPSYTPSFNKPTEVQGLGDEYKKDIFDYTYTANFNGFWGFLNALEENWDRFISIEDFDVRAKDNGMNLTGAKHDIRFKINTYYYIPKKLDQ